MDFRLNDDQRAIADLAASLFGDTAPSWATLVEAGLPALLVPEDACGVGLGYVEMALVLIAQGRGLATMPLWRHALAAQALGGAVDDERLALAVQSDAIVRRDGNDWRLDGRVVAVPGVTEARRLVLPARSDGDVRLFAVTLDDPLVRRTHGVLTDGEGAGDVTFDGAAASPLDRDGAWLQVRAASCLAALAVGVARGAIERTADYVSTRHQFDRPIGSFQAVSQRLADAFTDVEVAETLSFELAWRIDAGLDADRSADVATYWANQCSHRVAHAAMHLHGGIGADTSYPIHRVLLASRSLEVQLGGARRQIARIGARLAA